LDEPEVLQAKMKVVANLIRKSKYTIAYTGAGLSKASGIPDYATKATNSIVQAPKLGSSLDALPTHAHCVVTAMEQQDLVHYWVQQNHDGLPQKAGFPQEKMNEIHGAWFDPSNPVVQFSGSLRGDLFKDMEKAEKKIDLCLCLGTSLSGMNADRCANTPAEKMLKGKALGTVLINLQRTPLDDMCAVRVWAKIDDAFKILMQELGINEDVIKVMPKNGKELPKKYGDVFKIPYNENGIVCDNKTMTLDLRVGQKVRICHKGAMNENALGTIVKKNDGNWTVALEEKKGKQTWRVLGKWMIEAALRGAIPRIPIMNQEPVIVDKDDDTMDETTDTQEEEPTRIQVLQSHKLQGNDKHDWGLYLANESLPYVKQVEYTLHPTFQNPVRTLNNAPFKLECTGWGTFDVKVKIALKNGTVLSAVHSLSFQNQGPEVAITNISTK
jgi:NAD-dependent SIR2 family protein deacetylase